MSDPSQRLTGASFVQTLKGTHDEVYGRLLLLSHRGARTYAEWQQAVNDLRSQPVARDTPIRVRHVGRSQSFSGRR